MCGIAGFVDTRCSSSDETLRSTAAAMARTLRHRGPDDEGVWTDASAGVAFGFARLAILDLTESGHQPMVSPDGRYALAFNGEIYNHQVLRDELEGGVPFRGHSDTEVMLRAFEQWGVEKALTRLSGMFAFALFDRRDRELHLGRDRAGEKPLYYGLIDRVFVFGSELKALRAVPHFDSEVDRDVLIPYLRHGWIPGPRSIYRSIKKLPPATYLTFCPQRDESLPDPIPYWFPKQIAERGVMPGGPSSDEDAITELDCLLRGVVGEQMVSDVPLGAFLSGGIDSSLVVAMMQAQSPRPVKTFTIGFDVPGYDESPYAAAVASHLGTSHTSLYVTPKDCLGIVSLLPTMNDEPFGDVSQIPVHLVSKLARQSVTVALSGDGGDELFGGYAWYRRVPAVWKGISPLPRTARRGLARVAAAASDRPSAMVRRLLPFSSAVGDRLEKAGDLLRHVQTPSEVLQQFTSRWSEPQRVVRSAVEWPTVRTDPSQWPAGRDLAQQLMFVDFVSYLPDNHLVKVDRASMAVSLEVRAPLLDHRIAEFAFALPTRLKLRGRSGKYLLRRLLHRYVPPDLVERPKMGFPVPIGHWLRHELRDWAEALLDESRLAREGFFEPAIVRRKWREHLTGARNWQFGLWHVLMFQAWLEASRERTTS